MSDKLNMSLDAIIQQRQSAKKAPAAKKAAKKATKPNQKVNVKAGTVAKATALRQNQQAANKNKSKNKNVNPARINPAADISSLRLKVTVNTRQPGVPLPRGNPRINIGRVNMGGANQRPGQRPVPRSLQRHDQRAGKKGANRNAAPNPNRVRSIKLK